ncbi:MAG: glycoside-pentoside-hexuronide (GPH):cation symporter [Treponema sp.]|jgi:sugar (glycoside-pentoside-hexuronide) transporter|nr:glycoside-pentoside-hexuronide (GPH):cation symporter [Treponema sp.]
MNNSTVQAETPKTKFGEKLGFLTFSGANNIVYQFRSIYYLFFLTNVLKVSMGWAGLIVTAGTAWDAINDPMIGYWAVNRKFKNGEKIRPFALWHSVPWAATVVLIFTDFGTPQMVSAVIALVLYLIFQVFNTTISLPYNSMGGLATNRESDRRSINVFRNLGGCIGSAIGAVACLPLLKLFGALDSTGNLSSGASRGFFIVALIMGAIMVIGSLIHYATTKERVKQVSDEDSRMTPKQIFSMLFQCRSWWYNSVYIICYGVINFLLMSSLTYYATYVLGSTASATMIQASYLTASVLTSFVVSPFDRLLGRRMCMMMAALIAILGKIWFIIQPFSSGAMYMNAITVGVSVTFAFVLFNTNRNNIVEIVEARNGRRIDSMIATTDNLASKMATAGATLLSTLLLENAGYNANLTVQPAPVINVINIMLGWAPAAASAVMIIAAFFLPIEKEYANAREKLRQS